VQTLSIRRDAGAQETLALWCLNEDFERCCPLSIDSLPLAVGLLYDFGNRTGPVKVQIRIQMLAVEPVHRFGVRRRDMAEAHVFADDSSVLRFDQAVVPRAVCA
jgi:hypothetical protein